MMKLKFPSFSSNLSLRNKHYFILVAALSLVDIVGAQDRNVLFVGNSYTIQNNLNSMVRNLLNEHYTNGKRVTKRLAHDGREFSDQLENFPNALQGEDYWNYVVLQDQSQIPALYMYQSIFDPSLDALKEMNDQIQIYNSAADNNIIADTVLYQTWGRRDGDKRNPELFPDFLTMNEMLREGYKRFQEAIRTEERPVYIAPVGDAFELVYDHSGGGGTEFRDLYVRDGSHPSVSGTFLAANVIFATLTCGDPTKMQFAPDAVYNATYLRSVAQEAVQGYECAEQTDELEDLEDLDNQEDLEWEEDAEDKEGEENEQGVEADEDQEEEEQIEVEEDQKEDEDQEDEEDQEETQSSRSRSFDINIIRMRRMRRMRMNMNLLMNIFNRNRDGNNLRRRQQRRTKTSGNMIGKGRRRRRATMRTTRA